MSLNYTRKTPEEKQREIKELTSQMTEKIESYFVSEEKILEHLRFMSNFYNYSARNMALIDKQFPGARAVGSFNFWKSKGVSVKKGEKGIKILVPVEVEYFNAGNEKRDPVWKQVKYATKEEKEKLRKGEYQTKTVLFFKVGYVFEYTQTNAREKGLEVSEIFGRFHRTDTIENDTEFMEAFKKVAENIGVKIVDEPPIELGTAKGAFFPDLNIIALNPRNTMADNVATLIHELAHAELHNRERDKKREHKLTVNEKEFQAEMTAYVVATHYGIEMEDFSLPYLADWTKGATIEDKEQLLNEVRETASKFIDIIDEHFEMTKEKVLVREFENPTFLISYGHLSNVDVTPINSIKELLEKFPDKNITKELSEIANLDVLISTFNEKMANKFFLYELTDEKPKILIQFSEHDRLKNNQLMDFGEGNDYISQIIQRHLAEKKATLEKHGENSYEKLNMFEYFKTRYHVIIPSGNSITLINPDRFDLGDGYYNSPYQQLVSEKVAMITNGKRIVGELDRELHNKLLTNIAIHNHCKQHKDFSVESIKEPVMFLHGYTTEFKNFGKLNNYDFTKLNAAEIKYTIAAPFHENIYFYSNFYDNGLYKSPLDQIKNDKEFNKEIYSMLKNSSIKELTRYQKTMERAFDLYR